MAVAWFSFDIDALCYVIPSLLMVFSHNGTSGLETGDTIAGFL